MRARSAVILSSGVKKETHIVIVVFWLVYSPQTLKYVGDVREKKGIFLPL